MKPLSPISTGRVLKHARARGAKVILVGDPDQLKAIGPGDAFRGLVEQHGAARVDTIRRQADARQRDASMHLADGRLEPALGAYAERGAIQWHTDRDQARDALVMAYFEDRYLAPDESTLIFAHRKSEVRQLNDRIRKVRRDAGELGPDVRLNGRELAAGDRVLFLRNDHTGRQVRTVEGQGLGVKNGALSTLLEGGAQRLRIRLDSGRTVELDPRIYDRLDHGYAATVHKAQGATVDRAYVLADRGFGRGFGRLKGHRLLARSTDLRAKALDTARYRGSQGLERHAKLLELRDALVTADRYRVKSLDLSRERKALAPDRSELLGELRRQAEGLDLAQLADRLPTYRLKTLRDLEHADELHLEPMRAALESFKRACKTHKPRAKVIRLAGNVSALYYANPRIFLRRLAPPQLRLLLSATSLAAAALRKVSVEPEDRDKARRTVLRP